MEVGEMEETKINYKSERQNILLAFHKFLIRLLSLEVQVLENIYEMILECRMLYGVTIWSVKEGWEIGVEIQGRYCGKVFTSPTSTANGAVECEIR
jgi:hypothetical protein